MTTLPTWAVYAVSFGTPISAFIAVLIGHRVTRKGATELETRSKREETLRLMRWAAEMAVLEDVGKSYLGVHQLHALLDSDLLDEGQVSFVLAALEAVVDVAAERVEDAGDDVEVVQEDEDPVTGDGGAVPSKQTGGWFRWLRELW